MGSTFAAVAQPCCFLEPGARAKRRVNARALRRTVEEALRAREPALWAELFHNALALDAVRSKVDTRVARAAQFLCDPGESRTSAVHRMFGLPPSKVFIPELTGGIVEAPWARMSRPFA